MIIHDWIVNNLPKTGIVIEAGTYDGTDTILLAKHLNEGKIYGFEPVQSLYNKTIIKTKDYNNIKMFNLALSDKTEETTIYISTSSMNIENIQGSSSLLKPKDHISRYPEITFNKAEIVKCINLDEWYISYCNKEIIELLWLDIQGAEPKVLKNAPNILKNTKYIYTEFSIIELYEGVDLYDKYISFLNDNGFIVIDEERWTDSGNVLLKNTNLI